MDRNPYGPFRVLEIPVPGRVVSASSTSDKRNDCEKILRDSDTCRIGLFLQEKQYAR